jgi:hypothetical protein
MYEEELQLLMILRNIKMKINFFFVVLINIIYEL